MSVVELYPRMDKITSIVYIIKSQKVLTKIYIGYTKNLDKRLSSHNSKSSLFSKKYAPWELLSYVTFYDETKARNFEKYLKKGSGFAFLKKHLL